MLELLLQRLNQGGTVTLKELSKELSISEALVEQMIMDLVKMGYLEPVNTCEMSHCDGCAFDRSCHKPPAGRVWSSKSSYYS